MDVDGKQYKAMNLFTTMEQQLLNKVSTKSQRLVSYENGKIYKIKSSKGDKVYIGSTTQKYLSQRFAQHISAYKSYKGQKDRGKLSSFILFDEYGIESCSIELIDYCPCKSKAELERQEFMYINSIPCINNQKKCNELSTTLQQLSTTSQQKHNIDNPLSINCKFCPLFSCKLKTDYNRHISTVSHLSNEKLIKQYETTKQGESKDRLIERKLCLNHEFIHRSFFPVHKYYTRELFVDVRDRFSPSRDKEISYSNY